MYQVIKAAKELSGLAPVGVVSSELACVYGQCDRETIKHDLLLYSQLAIQSFKNSKCVYVLISVPSFMIFRVCSSITPRS